MSLLSTIEKFSMLLKQSSNISEDVRNAMKTQGTYIQTSISDMSRNYSKYFAVWISADIDDVKLMDKIKDTISSFLKNLEENSDSSMSEFYISQMNEIKSVATKLQTSKYINSYGKQMLNNIVTSANNIINYANKF